MHEKLEKLEKLKKLFDDGIISEEEYSDLKKDLISNGSSLSGNSIEKAQPVNCSSCGAANQMPQDKKSMYCDYCGGTIERKTKTSEPNKAESPLKTKPEISKRKNKNNNSKLGYYLAIGFVLFLVAKIFIFGESFNEIKKKYPEAVKFEKIENTSLVVVKNRNNKLNIYDIDSKNLILNKWYDGIYDSWGLTFYKDVENEVYEGVLINPDEYSDLLKYRDDIVQGKDPKSQAELDESLKNYGEEQKRLNRGEWQVCKNCTGKSCTRCFGRGYYYGKVN